MNSLEEAKAALIEDFSMYDEWLDKYEYLIDLGKKLDTYPEEAKVDSKLIKGCQSRVWLDWKLENGRLWFAADSDAIITKGIISLLIGVYSGRTPSRGRFLLHRRARPEGEPLPYPRERPCIDDRHDPHRGRPKLLSDVRQQRYPHCRRRPGPRSPLRGRGPGAQVGL